MPHNKSLYLTLPYFTFGALRPYLFDPVRIPSRYTSVSQNPLSFSDIFVPNGWEFLVQILQA